jgi:hypothetical protein
MEILDYCPACRQDKPLDDFARNGNERMPKDGALVCRVCRLKKQGPIDPLPALVPKYRKLLKDLLTSESVAEAARKNNLSENYVRSLISRKIPSKMGQDVAAAWQLLLEHEGLDLETIARVTKLLLHAMEPKWNPAADRWDFFPDSSVRLGTVKHLTRQHRVDPRGSGDFKGDRAAVVVINYDQGAKNDEKEVDGAFHIEVPQQAS